MSFIPEWLGRIRRSRRLGNELHQALIDFDLVSAQQEDLHARRKMLVKRITRLRIQQKLAKLEETPLPSESAGREPRLDALKQVA